MLPQIIYFLFFDDKAKFVPAQAQFQPFIYLNAVFLSVMCLLHYFWFGLFNKMLYEFIVHGKADDAQNKVEKKEDGPKESKPATAGKKRGSAEKLE